MKVVLKLAKTGSSVSGVRHGCLKSDERIVAAKQKIIHRGINVGNGPQHEECVIAGSLLPNLNCIIFIKMKSDAKRTNRAVC